jgi:hypothetical protein
MSRTVPGDEPVARFAEICEIRICSAEYTVIAVDRLAEEDVELCSVGVHGVECEVECWEVPREIYRINSGSAHAGSVVIAHFCQGHARENSRSGEVAPFHASFVTMATALLMVVVLFVDGQTCCWPTILIRSKLHS